MNKYQNRINSSVLPTLVYALTFSLFLGTAVFSILIALTISFWLLSGEWNIKLSSIRHNPMMLSVMGMLLIITLGLFWSHVPWAEKFPMYMKYHKLLYIPIVASILQTDAQRKSAMNAFLIVSLGILFISYGKFLGLLPFHDEGMGYVVTRNRIAHSIFMSFAAFLMLHRMVRHEGVYRYVWATLSALAVANVMFLVTGRTGQLAMMVLIAFFIWQQLGIKSIGYLMAAAVMGLVAYKTLPMIEHSGLGGVGHEMQDPNTSAGLRMGFYKNSIELIKRHPLLGVGTGAFKTEYHQQVGNVEELKATSNPHSQYLLMAVETGLVGLLLFLWFLFSAWHSAGSLNLEAGYAAQGLVVLFLVGSLFNSLLLDAGEGRFYCVILGVLVSELSSRRLRL